MLTGTVDQGGYQPELMVPGGPAARFQPELMVVGEWASASRFHPELMVVGGLASASLSSTPAVAMSLAARAGTS